MLIILVINKLLEEFLQDHVRRTKWLSRLTLFSEPLLDKRRALEHSCMAHSAITVSTGVYEKVVGKAKKKEYPHLQNQVR